ncbi:FecR domain-containing protein [Flammeovirga yaeyamensis]|uniref:FecR domain-containing protein n=1 Tax=Flammeovirga yaeyamensis TaxID=367791 RepID=A0AAX1N9S6_9BACT|nr:FecR family protein [Flammeovirga yaeyamensis]MBB3699308.1 ferric-dicitrate binding protein FerR (iron transport regulator) [Flammeovirga yaeyamensis]NMF35429.1 FecR family protein [Flammeovirga yaeyamensis]QWG04289.1 FecR domain-containing protein [Flammeovirga yaeyamensis]
MNKYKDYKAADFLQEEGFVSWLKEPLGEDKDAQFWNDWVSHHPEYYDEIQKAKKMYLKIVEPEFEDFEVVRAKDRVKDRLKSSIIQHQVGHTNEMNEKASLGVWKNVTRYAAAVAVIIGTIGWFNSSEISQFFDTNLVSIENNRSHSTTVLLSDGSSVVLSPNSTLKYPKTFDNDLRKVYLEGEGFFEIAKNKKKPFIVSSENVTTRVVGTSFSIKDFSDGENSMVSVVTGKVAVFTEEASDKDILSGVTKGEILIENQALRLNNASKQVTMMDNADHISSTFTFVDAPVTYVVDVLEKFYGVEIIMDRSKLGSCQLNATLLDMSFQDKIKVICQAMGYSYRMEKNTVILSGQGCP